MRAHFELWKSFTIDKHWQVDLSQAEKDRNEDQVGQNLENGWNDPWIGCS